MNSQFTITNNLQSTIRNSQLIIGATAMVYGFNMAANLSKLSQHVKYAELLFYWTPTENNLPNQRDIAEIGALAKTLDMQLGVHLPPDWQTVELLLGLIHSLEPLNPLVYVMHVNPNWPNDRARNALREIQIRTGLGCRLLVENLSFSVMQLLPLLQEGLAGLCLDVGHLWLADESVPNVFDICKPYISEVHLHGIAGTSEHLSLAVLKKERLDELDYLLTNLPQDVILNLEVFSENDFLTSLAYLHKQPK